MGPAHRRSGSRKSSGGGARTGRLEAGQRRLGLGPAFARSVNRALKDQGGSLSLSAPRSMFNVGITGARRFAGQSWPMQRVKRVGKAADATVNDVVLAMCSGRAAAVHGRRWTSCRRAR